MAISGLHTAVRAAQPEVIYSFPVYGENPRASLLEGPDGSFYGTTYYGGLYSQGTVFKIDTNGVLSTLYNFSETDAYGYNPRAGLVFGADGYMYGTTLDSMGNIFKISTSGVISNVVSFTGANGAYPYAGLTIGWDGNFYGTTFGGGSNSDGTVFKLTTNGVLTTLATFSSSTGREPEAPVILGPDGNFYGTTLVGGANGLGTVFRVTTNGVFNTLASFSSSTGENPMGGLALGLDGNFYGATYQGGDNGYGTVFKVTRVGMLTKLASFSLTNGVAPFCGLTLGNDGNFYGTTAGGGGGVGSGAMGAVFKVTTNGILTAIATFYDTNGNAPYASLTLGRDGNFYGTTFAGGMGGGGTAFQVTSNGVLTTLASFGYAPYGAEPYGSLTLGNDGNLYGTTFQDGPAVDDGGTYYAFGSVFKVTTAGVLTTMASFANTTGSTPKTGLVLGPDGNFYGTTYFGYQGSGYGTVFKMTTNGALTFIATFNHTNGASPSALIVGPDGNFYGTTQSGGSNNYGTVFEVTPGGSLNTLLFFNHTNGADPTATLQLGPDGNLYGTASQGGTGDGALFQMTNNGTQFVLGLDSPFPNEYSDTPANGLTFGPDGYLYSTTSQGTVYKMTTNLVITQTASFIYIANGYLPLGKLLVGQDGNLYGTFSAGGAIGSGSGTIFEATTNLSLTTLCSFGKTNGGDPTAGLTLGPDGNFYGTTAAGGNSGIGTIFRLGNPPYITIQPTNIVTAPGASVSFSVSAVGGLPLSYQWFTNGSALTDGGNTSGSGTLGLTLSSVSSGNAANYSVVVTNNYGSVTSSIVSLTIVPLTIVPPLGFTSVALQNGYLNLTLSGVTNGETVVLLTSTNLANLADWIPLVTNVASGPTLSFSNIVDPTILEQYFRTVVSE